MTAKAAKMTSFSFLIKLNASREADKSVPGSSLGGVVTVNEFGKSFQSALLRPGPFLYFSLRFFYRKIHSFKAFSP